MFNQWFVRLVLIIAAAQVFVFGCKTTNTADSQTLSSGSRSTTTDLKPRCGDGNSGTNSSIRSFCMYLDKKTNNLRGFRIGYTNATSDNVACCAAEKSGTETKFLCREADENFNCSQRISATIFMKDQETSGLLHDQLDFTGTIIGKDNRNKKFVFRISEESRIGESSAF